MTCRLIAGLFVLLWIVGIASYFAAASGAGDWADYLSALIMTPLGLPWNLSALLGGANQGLRLGIALGAPLINLIIVYGLCRLVVRRICPGC
jgi:hypothetical protein